VENLENGVLDCCGNKHVDAKDFAVDIVMLPPRTARGLDLMSFAEVFGGSLVYSLCKVYQPYIEHVG
jgi:oxygen-independent coproporphyrinogen-3 oxidase